MTKFLPSGTRIDLSHRLPAPRIAGYLPPAPPEEATHFKNKRTRLAIVATSALSIIFVIVIGVLLASSQCAVDDNRSDTLLEVSDIEFIPTTYSEAMSFYFQQSEQFTVADIDGLPSSSDGLTLFCHNEVFDDDVLISAEADRISQRINALLPYDVSFVFADLDSGCGIAYNIDDAIYGASTIKAVLAAYILQEVAETSGISSSTYDLISASVSYSDNQSFFSLSNRFAKSEPFYKWIESLGVSRSIFDSGDFATYTARDAAKMWIGIWKYLESGTEDAMWLSGLLEGTNFSPIRNSVEKYEIYVVDQDEGDSIADSERDAIPYKGYPTIISGGSDAVVRNKAGWIAEGGKYNAVCDNAIIESDGRSYLMCIMCSAPYSDSSSSKVTALARSLFDARYVFASMGKIESECE